MTKGCMVLDENPKNPKKYDVIIAGGGPSGLFCAVTASKEKKKVLVLEKKNSCGKKLLITGLSQCNLTQDGDIKSFFTHYGDNGKFLKSSLLNFTNKDLVRFFNERGLETVVEKGNKVFPVTKKALDVLEILLLECKKNGALIICDEKIISASQKSGFFAVKTDCREYICENLVIATGGITYPATGSTGDGYNIAKSFGHTVAETGPALCSVNISDYEFSDLPGISFENAKISIYHDNKKIRESFGDILFTHTGLSGPGILHMSRYIKPGDMLKISFLPMFFPDSFIKDFSERIIADGKKTVRSVIQGYGLYERFAKKILDICGISYDITCAHLPKDKKIRLSKELCEHNFSVSALASLNEAMVTRGGVILSEINPKTMESKVCPHLYFTGEVLDFDGDTGGYNLQAAFSTGYAAARNIILTGLKRTE
ncbi:MAG: NAD(P)/FAD-dependent oxidoreductase [Methanomicrobium sp.]|nr:NAD(P)/FAD-dependent oxidoreductase [Methanomicrobium sp.]